MPTGSLTVKLVDLFLKLDEERFWKHEQPRAGGGAKEAQGRADCPSAAKWEDGKENG
jgi:hypothetical protein